MFRWFLSAVLASAMVLGGMTQVQAGGAGHGKTGAGKFAGGKKGHKGHKKGHKGHKKGKHGKKTSVTA
jgi:hypothetical protein